MSETSLPGSDPSLSFQQLVRQHRKLGGGRSQVVLHSNGSNGFIISLRLFLPRLASNVKHEKNLSARALT